MVVYTPSTVQEAAEMVVKAFDVADRYRIGVMILGDGMIGQIMGRWIWRPSIPDTRR